MANDFDFDLLNEGIENAPSVGFGPQTNFGKMFLKVSVCHFSGSKAEGTSKFNEVDWDGHSRLNEAKREFFRFTYTSDMSEFNPAMTREWKRRIDVKKSGRKSNGEKNDKFLMDWEETVMPSQTAVLGADALKKLMKGVYVQWDDVDTVELNKDGELKNFTGQESGKTYINTAPKFVKVFKNKAECAAARAERFKSADADENASDIPAKTLADFNGLVSSLGEEAAVEIVNTNKPFGAYTGEELLEALKNHPPF